MLESEIIQSLEIVRGKVREQLLNVWIPSIPGSREIYTRDP